MSKPKTNPTGRVSVDLFEDKKSLDQQAKAAGTTGTNLARILIRAGLSKLSSGELMVKPQTLVPAEEGGGK